MHRKFWTAILAVLLVSCTQINPTASVSTPNSPTIQVPTLAVSPTVDNTSLPAGSPTPVGAQITPSHEGSPGSTNPLTGLRVSDPELLERRPMLVKVENLPRGDRPQSGLSLADLVFEYYTEQGSTRFAALFYGQDAEQVSPIRSARWFDAHLVRMYGAVFAFGSAYEALINYLQKSDFANRLFIETRGGCPPMCRIEPDGRNTLVTNTRELSAAATRRGVDNTRQDLSGMVFELQPPPGGQEADQVFVRFSSAVYNRWDYEPASRRYLRWVDTQTAREPDEEKYTQLVDRLTKEEIGADNVVIALAPYMLLFRSPEVEVFDINLIGTGSAYVARDGRLYPARWSRPGLDTVLQITDENGDPFPIKPGTTWFEVLHTQSTREGQAGAWRFTMALPR